MYTPTPEQAVQTVMSYVTPDNKRSFLDLATMASKAADKLEAGAAKSYGDKKARLLKAAKDTRKRSNLYVKRYMAGEVWDPMPTI